MAAKGVVRQRVLLREGRLSAVLRGGFRGAYRDLLAENLTFLYVNIVQKSINIGISQWCIPFLFQKSGFTADSLTYSF